MPELPYKWFYYGTDTDMIRIKAKRKPSANTRPRSGTWVLQEKVNDKWVMPCFPEITWGTLILIPFIKKELNNAE